MSRADDASACAFWGVHLAHFWHATRWRQVNLFRGGTYSHRRNSTIWSLGGRQMAAERARKGRWPGSVLRMLLRHKNHWPLVQ